VAVLLCLLSGQRLNINFRCTSKIALCCGRRWPELSSATCYISVKSYSLIGDHLSPCIIPVKLNTPLHRSDLVKHNLQHRPHCAGAPAVHSTDTSTRFRSVQLCGVFTHRRSIAERGGCFQQRLFVCQFVCLFVNTITFKRLNVG